MSKFLYYCEAIFKPLDVSLLYIWQLYSFPPLQKIFHSS